MRDFEAFLFHIPIREYFIMLLVAFLFFQLLKPFDWDHLRAPVSGCVFALLLTVKYVTGISYIGLLRYYFEVAFVDVWISLCLGIFYFTMHESKPKRWPVLRKAVLLMVFIFLFLFLIKQLVE